MDAIVVVGLGSIGQRHLANLRALGVCELAVVSRSRYSSLLGSSLLDGVTIFTELHEALRCHPRAVVVANPTAMHMETALAAARCGCRLFIEKPLAHTLDSVEELRELTENAGLTAMLGFQMRFHPGLVKIRALLRQGLIGRVICARAEVGQYLPDWHPAEDYRTGVSARRETGGGVILDLIHELDYVNWLFGPTIRVTAVSGHYSSLEIDTEDVAEILLQCAGAPLVEVHLDYIQRQASRTCQIVGEHGTIRWDYIHNKVELLTIDRTSTEWSDSGFERNQMYMDEMRHFLDCLQSGEKPVTNLEDGIDSLKIALAAKCSAETGVTQSLTQTLATAHGGEH